jgi:hypothetical protein
MADPIVITYHFTFDDQTKRTFTLELDPTTLVLNAAPPAKPPAWTALDYHRCDHCPLSADHPSCPIALNLASIAREFNDCFSHQAAYVEVVTTARTYAKATTIEAGLSALVGIIMTTSSCPVMEPLKPMVRFHLPFATLEETYFRMIATWLMAQFFILRKGGTPDLSLAGIEAVYEAVSEVNRCIAERLRATADKDANLNALVSLNFFAAMAPMAIEDVLEQLEPNFAGYLAAVRTATPADSPVDCCFAAGETGSSDGVTQTTVHTLPGPAAAAIDGYLGQAQSQTVLFANMVNQQQQLATIAAATLAEELAALESSSGDETK